MRMLSQLIFGLMGAAALVSQQATAADNKIVVGFAVAQSGFMEAYDTPSVRGATVRINEINASGGLLGKQIAVLAQDTKTDRVEASKAGKSLVDQGVDMLVVSGDFDMGAPAALAAQAAGKISFFPAAEDIKAGLQGVGKYSFNAATASTAQAADGAEWAYSKLGARNGYLLLDTTSEYSKSSCHGFEWMFSNLDGAKIVGQDTFQNDDTSVASQVTRIKSLATQPDVIFLCVVSSNGGAMAIRQLRAAGINAPIVAGDSMEGGNWLDSVPGLTGFYVAVQGSVRGDDPRPEANKFSADYAKTFGAAPDQQSAFSGYALIDLWARAVQRAGTTDAAKVTGELEKFKDEKTVTNPRSFSADLHIQNAPDFLIVGVKDGKFVVADHWKLSKPVPINVMLGKS